MAILTTTDQGLSYSGSSAFIKTGSDTVMTLTTSGEVGIGTTSPSRKFEVHENTTNLTIGEKAGYTPSTYGPVIETNANAITLPSDLYLAGSQASVRRVSNVLTLSGDNGIAFRYYDGSAGQEGMRLTNSGNFGIGTTSPSAKLHIDGAASDGTALLRIHNTTNAAGAAIEFDDVGAGGQTGYITYRHADSQSQGGSCSFHFESASQADLVAIFGGGGSYTSRLAVAAATSSAKPAYSFYDDNDTGLNRSGADTLDLITAGTTRLIVNSSGNIGIGTSSPAQKLTVEAGHILLSSNSYDLRGTDTGGNQRTLVRINSSNEAEYGSSLNGPIKFMGGGSYTERMRIHTNGNIGIGTTTPSYNLDVAGIIRSNTSNVGYLYLGNTAQSSIPGGAIIGQRSPSNTSTGNLLLKVPTWGPGTDYGLTTQMSIEVSSYDTKEATISMIPFGGKVGIGTTSPNYALDISKDTTTLLNLHRPNSSTAAASALDFSFNTANASEAIYARIRADVENNTDSGQGGDLSFYTASGGSVAEKMRITQEGYVGIATDNPTEKLSVHGKILITTNQSALNQNYYTKITSGYSANPFILESRLGVLMQAEDYGNSLSFHAGSAERIRIDGSTGNVGIGTTSPSGRLHVYGGRIVLDNLAASQSAIQFNSAGSEKTVIYRPSSSNDLRIYKAGISNDALTILDSNGNVGIGTSNPVGLLTISASGGTGLEIHAQDSLARMALVSYDRADSAYREIYFEGYNFNFNTSGANTRLSILNNGNVGIGTTSPDYKLDVAGDIGVDGYIYHNGDDSRIGFEGNDAIRMYTANSVRLQIQSNGNVGIGNTNPTSKLAVAGNIQSTAGGSWASNSGGVQLTYDGTDTGILSMYYDDQNLVLGAGVTQQNNITINGHTSDNNITFKVANSERMRILSSGQLIVGGTDYGYAGTKLQVGNTSDSQNGLNIITSSTGYGYLLFGDALATAGSYVGQIAYKHGDDFMMFQTAGSERMRIDSSGNVGINTTSPASKLHILQSGTAVSPDGVSSLVVQKSAAAGTAAAINIVSGDSAEASLRFGDTSDQSMGALRYLNDVDAFSIVTNNAEQMRITSAGGVGIGTTSPTYKLDVNGTIGGTQLFIQGGYALGSSANFLYIDPNTAFTSGIYINNQVRVDGGLIGSYNEDLQLRTGTTTRMTLSNTNGNVGIGTTSPSTELDVAGDISADGVITTGGTATAEVGSWLHVGRQWSFSGLPFFNKTTGSTAQRLDGAFMTDLNTGSAASRRAQAVFGAGFNDISGYSGQGTDYSRALGASIKAGFFITGQNSAKVIFAVGLASTSGVYADADPISSYGFGVEFRRGSGSVYEWRVFGHNGTTLTASSWSSSGITYATDPRTIAIYSDGSGNITAYTAMYGDTNYTTITTTGGPTASSGTGTLTNMVGLRCNTNASGYVTGAYAKARASAVNFYAE